MKRSSHMTIQQATKDYERWLTGQLEIVPEDLAAKHERMRQAPFPFLRATYYRWALLFPQLCKELSRAPQVLAVGDLHVENFGTWRDAEGRLVWGINDFDETCRLPYPHDLVRLATSAHLAIEGGHLKIDAQEACASILGGYREGLEASGRPFVLTEHSKALREMATSRLIDPQKFWDKLDGLPSWKGEVPSRAVKALSNLLPRPDLPRRIVHRVAGLGSLGRQRFVAIAEWQGGRIAREAKALAPSAAVWAYGGEAAPKVLYQTILDEAVRCVDPWVRVRRQWIVRRLAPDCSRIELSELPEEREETRLLRAMGWETANVHLGTRSAHALLVDLAPRPGDWLHHAAKVMLHAVKADWEAWHDQPIAPVVVRAETPAGGGATLVVLPAPAPAAKEPLLKTAKPGKAAKVRKTAKAGKRAKVGKVGKTGKTANVGKAAEQAGKVKKAGAADNSGKTAKPGKAATAGKTAKPGKAAAVGKTATAGKSAKAGKPPKAGKSAKAGKPAKARKARAGKPAKAGKAKVGKPAKPGRPAAAGSTEQAAAAGEGPERGAPAAMGERAEQAPPDAGGLAVSAREGDAGGAAVSAREGDAGVEQGPDRGRLEA